MYTNVAYIGKKDEDIVDNSRGVVVTAAGNYKFSSYGKVNTERPYGRGDYQLIYIANGKGHFYFDSKENIITKGNMIIFRPGEAQKYFLISKDKPEVYWVHFTGNEIDKLLKYYEIPENKNILFSGTSTDYQWIFLQLIKEIQLKRKNHQDLLEINLRQLFLLINRYMTEGEKIGTQMLDEIERATHYFNENYSKNIVIEKYAKEHFITPCWFIQNFKRVTKQSPTQYIISLRINNAMNLLDNTKYSVTQVSAAVGYENTQYFHRLFHKHTGMTPMEYKKRK